MRRICYNLLLFALLGAIGLFFYRNLFDGQVGFLIAVTVFFTVYGIAMTAGEYGMHKLMGYEHYAVYHTVKATDRKRILGYAILSLAPIDVCMLLASLIPIPTWEVWFVTVFPCLVLMYLPIKEVYDTQYPLAHYKIRFWVIEIAIFAVLSLSTQTAVAYFIG